MEGHDFTYKFKNDVSLSINNDEVTSSNEVM